jgi:signal transduction histidine kinase
LLERIVIGQVREAEVLMAKIDHQLFMAYEDMKLIAIDNHLRQFLESPSLYDEQTGMLADELLQKARLTGPWGRMTVFDREGHALFTPTGMGGVAALADSPQTRIAFESALAGEFYHSDRIVCRQTGQPVVVIAVPVFGLEEPNKVVGVVASHYAWGPIQKLLDNVEVPASIHLLNSQGNLIGHSSGGHVHEDMQPFPAANPARITLPRGKAGYVIMKHSTHGGKASLLVDVWQQGPHGYTGNDWILTLEMPLDKMYAPIVVLARNIGLAVAGVLLLAAVLASVFGRNFVRPLGQLVKGVRRVQRGDLDHKVAVGSKDEIGELAESFNTMVGELRKAQDELVHNEKLALLSQVADTVGHELRNPLGVMNNAVYFLQTVLVDADETTREYLGILKDEIEETERIVSDLLDAVRTKPPHPEDMVVAELLEHTLRKCEVPAAVTVRLDIPPTIPAIRVDQAQMQQVFWNLISNGVEAMPDGGVLEITASEDPAANSVTVSIRDSGGGITQENQARLFQPLFTTKARRVGLGLVVVKNLVQANGGSVAVDSEPGQGSTFSVTLPCGNPATAPA